MTERESNRWAAEAVRVQSGAGLFRIADRALVEIRGADRVRWLDGMLSNDVARLEAGPTQSGCYAALLTHQGRIVGDIHVAVREDAFWLEMSVQAVPGVMERLDKHIIADDVTIADISASMEWLGVEGPNAGQVITELAGRKLDLEPDCWAEVGVAQCRVTVGRWGTAADPGYRVLIPTGQRETVAAALSALGDPNGLVEAGPEALEILRIEAGIPRFGAELDESVLPAAAGLERAISQTKGCYIGQEVVARMASSGRSSHRLVGLRFETREAAAGDVIRLDSSPDSKKIGKITSVCFSAGAGPIALASVRSAHAVSGTGVCADGRAAVISDLPLGPVKKL